MSEPASIVIIEDDADINEVVAVHLRRNGFACTQAFSGSEGRLLLSGSEPFDLVITDLRAWRARTWCASCAPAATCPSS